MDFSVTVDDLLSDEGVPAAAEEENKEKAEAERLPLFACLFCFFLCPIPFVQNSNQQKKSKQGNSQGEGE